MVVSSRQPPPHARYLVLRGGNLFTATPCYGMHAPWWVAKTMDGEAEPVDMREDDQWWPLASAVHEVPMALDPIDGTRDE